MDLSLIRHVQNPQVYRETAEDRDEGDSGENRNKQGRKKNHGFSPGLFAGYVPMEATHLAGRDCSIIAPSGPAKNPPISGKSGW